MKDDGIDFPFLFSAESYHKYCEMRKKIDCVKMVEPKLCAILK